MATKEKETPTGGSERESEREREGGRGRAREWEIESGTTMHTHARLRLLYSTTAPLLPVLDHCSSASRPPLLCLPLARQVLRMLVLARSSVPPPPPPPPRLFPANALAGPATEVSLSLGPSTSAPCPPPAGVGEASFRFAALCQRAPASFCKVDIPPKHQTGPPPETLAETKTGIFFLLENLRWLQLQVGP